MDKKHSYNSILKSFSKLYPQPRSELIFNNPYELLVSVVLSAQCTDKKVNETTPALFTKFSNFNELADAEVSDVAKIIRPINYYLTKSKNIVSLANKVVTVFRGSIPTTHEELISLPGVGNKTANVVLGELKITPSLPVDTHVFRVSKRLGIAAGKNPDEVENSLKNNFQKKDWYNLHHWLIFHGRRVCKAQRPLCSECQVREMCEFFNQK